ncbi:MAG: GNAT family N-acetyltransferase [Acidobacteriaceae bacterium]
MVTLTTPRLLLRRLTPEDKPALYALLGNPETMRWYPRPWTPEEIDLWLTRQFAMYPDGSGKFAVTLSTTGEFLGDCGPTWFDVDGVQELEIGYRFLPQHWNQGYATESAAAVLAYTQTTLKVPNPISLIRPGNLPSRRVAEKNGAQLEKTVFWRDYDHGVYRYPSAK